MYERQLSSTPLGIPMSLAFSTCSRTTDIHSFSTTFKAAASTPSNEAPCLDKSFFSASRAASAAFARDRCLGDRCLGDRCLGDRCLGDLRGDLRGMRDSLVLSLLKRAQEIFKVIRAWFATVKSAFFCFQGALEFGCFQLKGLPHSRVYT